MTDEPEWIVVDLDGTICNCSHRVHLAQARQWDEFNAGIPDDIPHPEICGMLLYLAQRYQVLLCTGRDEKHRNATMNWLIKHELESCFDELIMRPRDNREMDAELKVRLVDEFFEGRENALQRVLVVLDDRDRVVTAFRDAGFKCWQVSSGAD